MKHTARQVDTHVLQNKFWVLACFKVCYRKCIKLVWKKIDSAIHDKSIAFRTKNRPNTSSVNSTTGHIFKGNKSLSQNDTVLT